MPKIRAMIYPSINMAKEIKSLYNIGYSYGRIARHLKIPTIALKNYMTDNSMTRTAEQQYETQMRSVKNGTRIKI